LKTAAIKTLAEAAKTDDHGSTTTIAHLLPKVRHITAVSGQNSGTIAITRTSPDSSC